MTHAVTVAPSSGVIVDADGQIQPLQKQRALTWRSRCTCGWRSAEYSVEGEARRIGEAHVRAMDRSTGSA